MTERIEKKDKKENEKENDNNNDNDNNNNDNNDMNITKIKKEEFMKKSKCIKEITDDWKNKLNNNYINIFKRINSNII